MHDMYTKFCFGNVKERKRSLGCLGIDEFSRNLKV